MWGQRQEGDQVLLFIAWGWSFCLDMKVKGDPGVVKALRSSSSTKNESCA